MLPRRIPNVLVLCLLSVVELASAPAEEANPPAATRAGVTDDVQSTVDRALVFLVDDAAKWRKERGCATCHHGCMTVWALSEAQSRGYAVPAEKLTDAVQWSKDLFVGQFSKPRDSRWGFNFVSLPGIYLALMSQTLPVLSRDEMHRVAVHLARHQEEDGSWLTAPVRPNTAPPTWESKETLALLALLAWEPYVSADATETAANRAARDKAVAWLAQEKTPETTQSLSLRLLVDLRTGQSAEQLKPDIDRLLAMQNSDGGWSQQKDLASDAYATGQVLWALSFLSVPPEHPQVGRAVAFLIATQQENGSWPMTPRSIPDVDPAKPRYAVPITYFGSAWATLGLVRFVPAIPDASTIQSRAFDAIRGYSGTFEVDANAPDKPVMSVKFRYEVDDEQLAKLTRLLRAFPALKSLHLASPHITDAGLVHLKALTSLEALELKETKVTDAGVADFQRALPKVQVQR